VTVRHIVLSIGALLVLGLGVYLLVEVRAQPAPLTTADAAGDAARVPDRSPDRGVDRAPDRGHAVDRTPHVVPPPLPTPPAARPAPPAMPAPAITAPPAAADDALTGPKLDAAMDEANRAYDRGDFDDAKTIAARLLAVRPTNVRMLRILVSASCIEGDSATALTSYLKLPAPDQAQMQIRCARFGVSFPAGSDGK
jgi:hypothetical protein